MITFQSLEGITIEVLTDCFNAAFANYFVAFNATPEYLKTRWHGARVDYQLSFGAFHKEKLVGFIMNGIDERDGHKTAFNVATGVIPAFRGQRIVKQLYQYAIPLLKKAAITKCGLEVIQENLVAIKAYESVGFQIERGLYSYGGEIKLKSMNSLNDVSVRTLETFSWDTITPCWDFQPSWEQLPQAIDLKKESYTSIGLFKEENLIGYAILDKASGQLASFGIQPTYRKQGYGQILFQAIRGEKAAIRVINVENSALRVIDFLKKIGLENIINQYEMAMNIDS